MNNELRRQMDKEMLEIIKIIPKIDTKVDEMHRILVGNGKDGLIEKFEKHEKQEIFRYGFAGGVGATVVTILKLLKIL